MSQKVGLLFLIFYFFYYITSYVGSGFKFGSGSGSGTGSGTGTVRHSGSGSAKAYCGANGIGYLFYDFNNAHRHSVSALVAKQSKNHLCQNVMRVRVRVTIKRSTQLNVATVLIVPGNSLIMLSYRCLIFS
jgi:hypothetical protein